MMLYCVSANIHKKLLNFSLCMKFAIFEAVFKKDVQL